MTVQKILSKTLNSLQPGQVIHEFNDPDLRNLITDLKDTLAAMQQKFRQEGRAGAGVGLAANQIDNPHNHFNVYVVSVLPERAQRENCQVILPTVYLNTNIIESRGELILPEEACLSIAGIAAINIKRFKHITIEYHDEQGLLHQEKMTDFIACIHQHESDHNAGKEYLSHLNFTQHERTQIINWCENKNLQHVGAVIVPGKLKCVSSSPDVNALKMWVMQ